LVSRQSEWGSYPAGVLGVAAPVLPSKEALSLAAIPLAIFIIGASIGTGTGLYLAVKTVGYVAAVAVFILSLRGRFWIAPEAVLYIAWLTWTLSGAFEVRSTVLFWEQWLTIAQISVLLLIVSIAVNNRRMLSVVMLSLAAGVSIGLIYGWSTGQFAVAASAQTEAVGTRAVGWAVNPNGFAWGLLLATVALAYFWMLPSRRPMLKRVVLIAGMACMAIASVLTGSRMGFVGLIIFYLAWFWFCHRTLVRRHFLVFLLVLVCAGVVVVFTAEFLQHSFMGERLVRAWDVVTGVRHEGSTDLRMSFFVKGAELVADNPVAGVGLANFMVYSGGWYAHSDYVEIGATTGIVGFALYFSIFALLWFRTGRIRRNSSDEAVRSIAGIARTLLVVMAITGLANVCYYDKSTWAMLAGLIGYTNIVWHQMRSVPSALLPGLVTPGTVTSALPGSLSQVSSPRWQ
jgi:O-antigen ligase